MIQPLYVGSCVYVYVCSYKWALVGKCVRISWPCGEGLTCCRLVGILLFSHMAGRVCHMCGSFPFPTRHKRRVRYLCVDAQRRRSLAPPS